MHSLSEAAKDKEQIMTKQTPHMKLPTHKQRRTATEEWSEEKLLGFILDLFA